MVITVSQARRAANKANDAGGGNTLALRVDLHRIGDDREGGPAARVEVGGGGRCPRRAILPANATEPAAFRSGWKVRWCLTNIDFLMALYYPDEQLSRVRLLPVG